MLALKKILLPVVFTDNSAHFRQLACQAAWLARRFNAQIILLHVVTPFSYPYGMLESGHEITARDWEGKVVQWAQKDLDEVLLPQLEGIAVTRVLLRGDPAGQIVEAARFHNAGLIVMSTRGEGVLYRLLLGSVTAKVLHETSCPIWIGVHSADIQPAEAETPKSDFSVRRILCSRGLNPHNRHTLARAAEMAAAVDATLTLVHITGSVEFFGPGGYRVSPEWKATLVGIATEEIAKLQKDAGTNAEVIIDSGNVPQLLNRAAEHTKADVLIVGHIPGRSHLGDNGEGYGIIRESRIPVLSV
jgi:nucleotide-binding universal stress UspA family protein